MFKRIICLTLLFGLLVAVLPAAAVTVAGRAGSESWNITYSHGGQLVLIVYWKTKSAMLYLTGSCSDGAAFISGSLQDRFQRVEIGVDPGTRCEIAVQSRRGASKYWMNVQGTGMFGARTPELEVTKARGRGARAPRAFSPEGAEGTETAERIRPKSE